MPFAEEVPLVQQELQQTSVQDSDAFLAQELSQLSIQERNEVLFDLHGVRELVEETPELVESSIRQLQVLLEDHRQQHPQCPYDWAVTDNPTYFTGQDFYLLFLRSQAFHVPHTATRIHAFLQSKLDLFGRKLLGVPKIQWQHLTADDHAILESGYIQVLPRPDRAGRAVLWLAPHFRQGPHSIAHMKALYYVTMTTVMESPHIQRAGVVFLAYNVGNNRDRLDQVAVWKNGRLMGTLPYRLVGLHYCYDNPALQMLFTWTMFDKYTRNRFRLHYGTHLECIYELMTFGISNESLPLSTTTGEHLLDQHLQWCRQRQEMDAVVENDASVVVSSTNQAPPPPVLSSSAQPKHDIDDNTDNDTKKDIIVTTPSPQDVLFGRGRPIQEHAGNLVYSQWIEEYRPEYDAAKKLRKTEITVDIVHRIQRSGGRFLKPYQENTWKVVSDAEARTKISHGFRNRRAVVKQKEQNNNNNNNKKRSTTLILESSAGSATSVGSASHATSLMEQTTTTRTSPSSMAAAAVAWGRTTPQTSIFGHLQQQQEQEQSENNIFVDFFAGMFGEPSPQEQTPKRARKDDGSSSVEAEAI